MNKFGHSGDIGDIIYSLPTIKACGGGELVLYNKPGRTYQPMTYRRYLFMKDLLDPQEYIFNVRFSEKDEGTSIDGFRDHCGLGNNNSEWHLSTHGLNWIYAIDKWLICDSISRYPVVIAWTPRHHSFEFPWRKVVDTYKKENIGFVGYEKDWKTFCNKYGEVCYQDIDNLKDAAEIINGSSLYVGNLTSMTAVAEGLKKKMIVEGCHGNPANDFVRFDSIIAYTDRFRLPCLNDVLSNTFLEKTTSTKSN